MIREVASRIPAQNAVHMPTGPAPITVMSRISSRSLTELGRAYAGSISDSGAPSKAPSARSTEHEMQVKVGVSRRV